MTGEECEKNCFYFRALMRIDSPLALRSKEARGEIQRGEEYPGSAESLCGTCTMLERNRAALEEGQRKSLVSR